MRTDHKWFQGRLSTTWTALPSRSCLFIVPPGCDSLKVSSDIAKWVSRNSQLVLNDNSLCCAVSRVTVDSVSSSIHFARRLKREMSRTISSLSQFPDDEYPADQVESLVGAVNAEGAHPVVIIDRFHAFARIADDHLLSVLSIMRQLEHDRQLTTIAVSPMNYRDIRSQLSDQGKFPFVNSAYGDNHDQVVIPALTRAEFVAEAQERGLDMVLAQKLYSYLGGPDCIYSAAIAVALENDKDIVERTAHRIGNGLERFFDVVIGQDTPNKDDLRLRIATGRLSPVELSHLGQHELSHFLLKKSKSGGMIVSSPILGRLLLTGKNGPWRPFARILNEINDKMFSEAARQVDLLDCTEPHLEAFCRLIKILAAVYDGDKGGLLEIDWKEAGIQGKALLAVNLPITPHREWVEQIVRWSERVQKAIDSGRSSGARLDVLTRQASDRDTQRLLEFAFRIFLTRTKGSGSPAEKVRVAGSIPESILQALAAYLQIDPLNVPDEIPDLDYQKYFGNLGKYRRPVPGDRLDLTHLLVIVPALLDNFYVELRDEISLCDESFVKPLHQRLVVQIRNATAHTYYEMTEADAEYFFNICDTLLEDVGIVWRESLAEDVCIEPDRETLADLLNGLSG